MNRISPASLRYLSAALASLAFFLMFTHSFIFSKKMQLNASDSLKIKFSQFHKTWPQERLYLQTDKPLYAPGETIWFSVFAVSEPLVQLPGLSELIYVEWINPKGSVEKKITLIGRGGKANGDFQIAADMPGGMYKLKAFSLWMQQQGQYFERSIQVQEQVLPRFSLSLDFERKAYKVGEQARAVFEVKNQEGKPVANAELFCSIESGGKTLKEWKVQTSAAGEAAIGMQVPQVAQGEKPIFTIRLVSDGEEESVSRPIPIVEDNLLVYFFPEGGDFVENRESKMAFRVLKPDSTPADAEGWLVNQKNQRLTWIKTLHDGMGFFFITPKAGETYAIEWSSPISQRSILPEPLETGYSLAVSENGSSELQLKVASPTEESLLLVAQMRGKWLWEKRIKTNKSGSLTSVSTQNWPSGVLVFSLFDSRSLLRCERRVFINSDKKLKVSLKTDKEQYQTREKVTLNVRISDEKGIPVPGAALVSVVSQPLLSYADDKQGHLPSSLLLEQELNTKLEKPDFYFSDQPKAKPALDLVMLTHGWRGISWQKMQEYQQEKPGIKPEKATIAGIVLNPMTQKPEPGVKLVIGQSVVVSDTNGKFRFPFIDLTKPAKIKLSKGKEPGHEQLITHYSDETILFYPHQYVLYDMQAIRKGQVPMAVNEMAVADFKAENAQRRPLRMEKAMPAPPKPGAKAKKAKADGAILPLFRRALPFPIPPVQDEESPYYLARKFPNMPPPKSGKRTDFSTTLFWSGIVDLDANGRGTFSFYTKDELNAYKATAEAVGPGGLLGVGYHSFFTSLPYSISTKIPVELRTADDIELPLILKNKLAAPATFKLTAQVGEALTPLSELPETISLTAGQSKEIKWKLKAQKASDSCLIRLKMEKDGEADTWEKNIRIVPQGFPVELSVSGKELEKHSIMEIKNLIPGSLKAHATAYPDATSSLLAGVESILAEPFGCFEQTSMTSYPNVLVLNYLNESGSANKELRSKAEDLLEKGYKKLVSFETREKGYEWFGGSPAHEALTAYGLLQFKEMQKVAPYVDQAMVDRTATWLLNRRDGQGGFLRSPQALDNFGRASKEITDAYIVYSLAEAGYQQLDQEINKVVESATASKDPYLVALVCNTLWLVKKEQKAREFTQMLLNMQSEDGSWVGKTHSITYSTGEALKTETTSFALLALLRSSEPPKPRIDKAVSFLCAQRKAQGGFGNSQATIVALKALTAYVVFSKVAPEDGSFSLTVNQKQAGNKEWKAGEKKPIVLEGWEKLLLEGPNTLHFAYQGLKDPLPYTIGLQYYTSLPPRIPGTLVDLKTRFLSPAVALGKPVQMEIELKNESNEGLPMTMACIGLPGGCVASPVELKSLVESRKVDFYEIKGSTLYLYYRQMAPGETKKLILTLNAVFKGSYQAPASSAYLYYTAEKKTWAPGLKLEVK